MPAFQGNNLMVEGAYACAVQIIGVAASVIGDMSSRPHWGLYELDFVFSTLVVCPSSASLGNSGAAYHIPFATRRSFCLHAS